MAGSLDELLRFLLDQIALSGQLGSTPAQILDFVNQFYQATNEHAATSENNLRQARGLDCPTLDRAFLEQVWRWLTKHPDVRIGRDGQGNKMSLSALEAHYLDEQHVAAAEAAKNISTLDDPDLQQQQQQDLSNGSQVQSAKNDPPRIYVSEQRMWLAICGHPKDSAKLFETEFVLLSIIASHREDGILQGDLVKQSGQDKRSVPKRTDELRNKGYIEKRAVHLRGLLKTSRLVLWKFASDFNQDLTTSMPVSAIVQGNAQREPIDVPLLIRNLFSILKEKLIITRDDLKKELGLMTKWQVRVFSRVIRKLEVIGCLKRVKAASEESKKVRYYFYCVKLIHEPSASDLDAFYASGTSITHDHAVEGSDPEDEAETAHTMGGKTPGADAAANQLEEVGRILPQWNPDRPLANLLCDVVHEAGLRGFTNRELRQQVLGNFVRRPIEHLLTRLTTLWFQSQPPHLRHLAIVRDTILSGTLPQYVQYSFPNFEARVESGQAHWEAVRPQNMNSAKKGNKKSSSMTPVSSTGLMLDEFGFPARYHPSFQHKGARTTLGQGLLAAQPQDLPVSHRDATLYHHGSGAYTAELDEEETGRSLVGPVLQQAGMGESRSALPHPSGATKKSSQPRQPGARPKGRPRKFLRGTEKFWQGQFAMARALASGNQHKASDSQAGLMTDPAGLSLFAKRPPLFDATLVRALEHGLPVPGEPKDITQEWVDKILPILNRSVPGLYITPKGVRMQGFSKHKIVSRVLILRSSRLAELNFAGRNEFPVVLCFASSAAHTFADLGNKFLGETVVEGEADNYDSATSHVPAGSCATELRPVATEMQEAIPTPISHMLSDVERDRRPPGQEECKIAQPEKRRRGRPRKSETANSGRASVSNKARPSRRRNSQDTSPLHVSTTQILGSPCPLVTRSALRKTQSPTAAITPANEPGKAPTTDTSDKSRDQYNTCPEDAATAAQTKTWSPIDMSPASVDPDKTRKRSKKQSTLVATLTEKSQGDITKLADTADEVLRIPIQAPGGLQPGLQSTVLRGIGPQPATVGGTAGSEKINTPCTEYSRYVPLNDDERDSEAFKLVQELTTNEEPQSHRADQTSVGDGSQQRVSELPSPEANGRDSLPELRISDVESDEERPGKRSKQDGIAVGSVAVLRRKILLDLMEASGGALPYYANALWHAFVTAWRKVGQLGKPDLKTIKAVVKSLCQNGSTKQIKFSHRNKRGLMTTKTILAKADMAVSDRTILGLQRKMIEADPHPYLPEALHVDHDLKRDIDRPRSTPWPAVLDEQTVEPSVIPAKVLRLQLREALSRAREGQRRTRREEHGTDDKHDAQSGNVIHRARLGGIRRKYTTSLGPYQKPELSLNRFPRTPQQPFSNRITNTPNALHFRTEIPPVPLTFQAVAPQKRPTPQPQESTSSHTTENGSSISHPNIVFAKTQVKRDVPTPIEWRKYDVPPVLPSSLEGILLGDPRRNKPEFTKQNDVNYSEFEWKVDGVALWEQRTFWLFDFKSTNFIFINHVVGDSFQVAPDSKTSIKFDGLIWFDGRGRLQTEKRFHAIGRKDRGPVAKGKHSAFQEQPQKAGSHVQTETAAIHAPRKRKRASADTVIRSRKSRRRLSTLTMPQTFMSSAGDVVDVSHLIGAKYRRSRGSQHLRTMPTQMIYKLTVTVVVVRALAGGLEKHVDWPLVMCVFPDEDEQFLKGRWRTLANKHRRHIHQLSQSFQERFPEAYAKGEVPQINFDDLESTDWEGIVGWALNSLDKPAMHEIPELPATRSELNANMAMSVEVVHRPYRELFSYNQPVTVPMKEAAISAIPFTVPLPPPLPISSLHHPPHPLDPSDEISNPALALAESWALSTITTPLESFDPAKAHGKLQTLAPTVRESESLVESAMKSLASRKAVAKKQDRSVDAKGGRFDLSRAFTDALDQRRTIHATLLRQAVGYKITVLDPAFRRNETVEFQPVTVEDGYMIAILNLVAYGRIQIRTGDDVPRNRWGIDQGMRYQTRSINKESLYFTVLLVQVPEKYIFGNPLSREGDSPLPALGSGPRDKIPIWRNIDGGLQRSFWDLAVAAVLGILASRPGASIGEVTKMMSPSLRAWEVECLLTWCLEVGAVKKTGDDGDGRAWTGGWEVREWWWMILELGGEVDNAPAEEGEV